METLGRGLSRLLIEAEGGGGNYSPLLSLAQHVVATSIANDAGGPAGGQYRLVYSTNSPVELARLCAPMIFINMSFSVKP